MPRRDFGRLPSIGEAYRSQKMADGTKKRVDVHDCILLPGFGTFGGSSDAWLEFDDAEQFVSQMPQYVSRVQSIMSRVKEYQSVNKAYSALRDQYAGLKIQRDAFLRAGDTEIANTFIKRMEAMEPELEAAGLAKSEFTWTPDHEQEPDEQS